MRPFAKLFVVLLCAVKVSCAEPPGENTAMPAADLVLTNGNVITVDADIGTAEAIAINGYRITAVGSSNAMAAYIGTDTKVIDLGGDTVIPGLIEGHGHFLSLGRAKQILDLGAVASYAEILTKVAAEVDRAAPGQWIYGRGWHQDKWQDSPEPQVDGVPTHASLSALSPDNPVLLGHASGHAAFANAKALEIAGIDATTPDPPGGTIVRDASGQPTGLLRETAQRMVEEAAAVAQAAQGPEAQKRLRLEQVQLAGREALSYGITSFHDAGADFASIDFFAEQEAASGLPIRLYGNGAANRS